MLHRLWVRYTLYSQDHRLQQYLIWWVMWIHRTDVDVRDHLLPLTHLDMYITFWWVHNIKQGHETRKNQTSSATQFDKSYPCLSPNDLSGFASNPPEQCCKLWPSTRRDQHVSRTTCELYKPMSYMFHLVKLGSNFFRSFRKTQWET